MNENYLTADDPEWSSVLAPAWDQFIKLGPSDLHRQIEDMREQLRRFEEISRSRPKSYDDVQRLTDLRIKLEWRIEVAERIRALRAIDGEPIKTWAELDQDEQAVQRREMSEDRRVVWGDKVEAACVDAAVEYFGHPDYKESQRGGWSDEHKYFVRDHPKVQEAVEERRASYEKARNRTFTTSTVQKILNRNDALIMQRATG